MSRRHRPGRPGTRPGSGALPRRAPGRPRPGRVAWRAAGRVRRMIVARRFERGKAPTIRTGKATTRGPASSASRQPDECDSQPAITGSMPHSSGGDGAMPHSSGSDGAMPHSSGSDGAMPHSSGSDGAMPHSSAGNGWAGEADVSGGASEVAGAVKASRLAASSVMAECSAAVRRRNGEMVSASRVIFHVASHRPSMRSVPWVAPFPGQSGTGRLAGFTRRRSACESSKLSYPGGNRGGAGTSSSGSTASGGSGSSAPSGPR
jgi:hypothetical protein